MSTAKDFRNAIAYASSTAVERYPDDERMRLMCFVSSLKGWLTQDESKACAELAKVLAPKALDATTDGA